jgi:hypothetical protein
MNDEIIITKEYLIDNPNHIFVFGDNLLRCGMEGVTKLRHHKNTYGFITKKAPTNKNEDFYKPSEYLRDVFWVEMYKLKDAIESNPNKLYLIN